MNKKFWIFYTGFSLLASIISVFIICNDDTFGLCFPVMFLIAIFFFIVIGMYIAIRSSKH